MAGTLVSEPNFRAIFWGMDSTGLVVATALLALKFFRRESDVVAAGFLVFAIGEAVMLSATAESLEAMVPAFGAGTALWSAALLLTSLPKCFRGLDPCRGNNRSNSVRGCVGKDSVGRTNSGYFLAAPLFGVSVFGSQFRWLDLDTAERNLNKRTQDRGGL